MSSIIAGIAVNIVTAVIIWLLLERRASKRAKVDSEINNQKIIKSELLGQYPTIINTNLKLQYLAFKIANFRYCKTINFASFSHEIMNDLRHITNTQNGLYEVLTSLGVKGENLEPFVELSNEIAIISISLYRTASCSKETERLYPKWYDQVKDNPISKGRYSTHWDRIEILLRNLIENCKKYSEFDEKQKLDIFINLGEAMGHLACLFNLGIINSFKEEIKSIE